jgi:hypothetical protein
MKYAVYDLRTGIIRAKFDTSEADMESQCHKGEGVLIGDHDPALHFIDPDTQQPRPLREWTPTDGSVWDKHERNWVQPQVLLQRDNALVDVEIAALERASLRPLRALMLHDGRDSDARERLAEIDRRIGELRSLRG